MEFERLIENLTPDVYRSLKRAVEIGKWPDGRVLSPDQRELCMEAVILFEARYINENERIGFIEIKPGPDGCESHAHDHAEAPSEITAITWKH